MFLKPEKLQNHSNEGKTKEKKKKKRNGCTLSFYSGAPRARDARVDGAP